MLMENQPPYNNKEIHTKVKAKLQMFIDKGYVELVDIKYVELHMCMFHIPKERKASGLFAMGPNLG